VSERIVEIYETQKNLGAESKPMIGMRTGNNEKYLRLWTEINIQEAGFSFTQKEDAKKSKKKWFPYNKGGGFRKYYGNNENLVNWENDGFEIKSETLEKYPQLSWENLGWKISNEQFFFKEAITWSFISSGSFGVRYSGNGFLSDVGGSFISPKRESINYLTGFLNSKLGLYFLKITNPTLNFQPSNISSLPYKFSVLHFEKIDSLTQKNINKSKSDWDSRETSWDFIKSPLLLQTETLKESYLQWNYKVTSDFFELNANEEVVNSLFIDIYGLQEELNPDVPLTEITILQDELDLKKLEKQEPWLREKGIGIKAKDEGLPLVPEGYQLPIRKDVVMKQLISYAIGVNMGRYRLDKPGLNIAHSDPSVEELGSYSHNGFSVEIDEDGIIPLMGTACTFADDSFQRVKYFLEVVWGRETLTQNLNFLQECLDEDLESYLVKKFWSDHCKTYKKKPIYWLFSSEKGAFQILTYMHRMNAFTVEKIRSNYLMPHLQHLRSQIDRLESGREDPRLLDRLLKNLSDCESYDLKLKDIADRQIVFDLDDGVTRNYELFKGVVREVK
jgi:hypothetical protein